MARISHEQLLYSNVNSWFYKSGVCASAHFHLVFWGQFGLMRRAAAISWGVSNETFRRGGFCNESGASVLVRRYKVAVALPILAVEVEAAPKTGSYREDRLHYGRQAPIPNLGLSSFML